MIWQCFECDRLISTEEPYPPFKMVCLVAGNAWCVFEVASLGNEDDTL